MKSNRKYCAIENEVLSNPMNTIKHPSFILSDQNVDWILQIDLLQSLSLIDRQIGIT